MYVQCQWLLLIPVLLFVIFFHPFSVITDPDFWCHVRTGQYIYETGVVPGSDIYSYTVSGQPWITHEWLAEVLFFVISQRLGYVGLVALFGLISVLTWLAVYVTCRRYGVGELGSTVLMLFSFSMARALVNVRPQVLTMLLLSISVLIVTRHRQGKGREVWLLPLLMMLWVNLHGGYVIGLAYLWLTVFGDSIARKLGHVAPSVKTLLIVSLLSTAATLFNPHSLQALSYPFTYIGSGNASMRFITEWQSPDFHQFRYLLFAAAVLVVGLLGALRRPLGITESLWMLVFTVMGLQSVRHIPLYAIVVVPLLGARLQAEIPSLRRSLSHWRRPVLLIVVVWLAFGASALRTAATVDKRMGLQIGREPNDTSYPAGAVDYIRTHDLTGNLFHEYRWGGYLIYNLYPWKQVFVDGRADVYGDEFISDFVDVMKLRPIWRNTLERYNVQEVLVEKDGALAVILSEGDEWQQVYEGESEILFIRQ